jgi:hypothetical protein
MRIRLAPAAAALFALTAAQAQASDHDPNSGAPLPPSHKHETTSPITDRFYVRGSYWAPHVSTLIQVNPHNAPAGEHGTTLSAERDLGLESRLNQGEFEMMFRIGNRNKIRVNWLEVDRSATHQLAETINFGEESFPVNSLLQSEIDWRIFTMTYTYSVIRNDWVELGTGLGIHLLEAEAQAQVNATFQRQDVSGAGAFPTIPLDFALRISQRWSVTWRGQYFHAAISNFDGWLADLHEDVQYRWKKNFAVGVGYSSVRAKLALSTGNFPGQFHMALEGPEAFFRISF